MFNLKLAKKNGCQYDCDSKMVYDVVAVDGPDIWIKNRNTLKNIVTCSEHLEAIPDQVITPQFDLELAKKNGCKYENTKTVYDVIAVYGDYIWLRTRLYHYNFVELTKYLTAIPDSEITPKLETPKDITKKHKCDLDAAKKDGCIFGSEQAVYEIVSVTENGSCVIRDMASKTEFNTNINYLHNIPSTINSEKDQNLNQLSLEQLKKEIDQLRLELNKLRVCRSSESPYKPAKLPY